MNQRRFIIALLLIVIVLGAVSLRTGQTKEKIVFAESTDMLAVTVDDVELTLADLAFYIAYEEGVMEKEAYIYNSEDTGEYWRLYSNHTSFAARRQRRQPWIWQSTMRFFTSLQSQKTLH